MGKWKKQTRRSLSPFARSCPGRPWLFKAVSGGVSLLPKDKMQILVRGEDKTDSISSWRENGDKFDITYANGKTYSYNASNIKIISSALSNEIASKRFEYLKRIAQTVGLHDNDGNNILANRYEKIDFLNNESMLSIFLTGKMHVTKQVTIDDVVFPFGFNLSQKTSVINALEHPLTIIEGPPGTGKTQTIINIIANAVMRNESVAVISSNNSATANVLEKLGKYQVDFIAASLGNSENKAKFIESQKPLPDMTGWKISSILKSTINHSLQNLYTSLDSMLAKKNELAQVKRELDNIKLEHEYFNNYCNYDYESSLRYLKPAANSIAFMELWLSCERYAERGKMPGIIQRIINYIFSGIIDKTFYLCRSIIKGAFYSADPEILIMICQKRWYIARIVELTLKATLLQEELNNFNFDQKMNEYTSLSTQVFHDYLSKKYDKNKRKKFALDDLWKNSNEFIKEYPVILSTAYSLRSSLSAKTMYDYVIIDESSQVDIVTGALALSCAKKAVIVGDLKQLPNVVDSETAMKTDTIFTEFDLPEVYRYKNHSLLLSVLKLFPDTPRVLLREHYRCHPKIIEFCNQKFYNNQLIILTEPKSDRKPLMVYKTVPGNHARQNMNQRQIDMIKNEIIPDLNITITKESIGIVTPYRNQTKALQRTFAGTDIQADTVDKFQGRENNVIILSTVDNVISDFTDNTNRLNVAISRAIDQLVLVINDNDKLYDKNIGDLIRYIEFNNFETIHSNIHSIFDYLYKNNRDKRKKLLRIQGRISEYDSENLMYGLICKVLCDDRFSKYDVVSHVPIKMILRNMDKLNEIERQYAQNILTHVDFLIFERIGKTPRLVIEVDGTAFHAKGTRQAERDIIKNGILEKYELPYIRFKTDGSNEKERLIAALSEL